MVAEKLTVVQVLPELDEGGVEGETLDLAIYLARNGYRSVVISGGGRLVPQLEKNGCIHVLWPHIGEKSLRCLQYVSKLRKYLQDERVDILHLRSRLPAWIGYLAWKLVAEKQRPSLITTFHGFYSVNSYSRIMTKGEKVAAVSETIKQHIIDNYKIDEKRISLIHGGFDVRDFSPDVVSMERIGVLREKWLPRHDGAPIIILPGRLTQWKGQDLLIESLARIKDQHFVGLLIGETEENPSFTRKLLEQIRYHGLQDKILLVGHCTDMPAALLLADVVVSASSTQPEAFGKVAIEAMAMGKPVIATAHGGSLETVLPGKTGWLVPPLDPVSMANAIMEALENLDHARQLGMQGRIWVNERFTAKAMCEKTLALYHQVYSARQKERRLETLTVLQLLPELNSGGVERGTVEMGRYLVRNGHKSIVASGGGRLVEQLEQEGSYHFQKNIGSKSPISLLHILPLRRLIKKNRVTVLHLRSRMPAWIGYVAWLTLPKNERPILVTTFHGFYSVNAYSAIMTKGDGVIAVSESIKRHIFEKYRRNHKVRLVFRGVDAESFAPALVAKARVEALKDAWQIDREKPVLMLPGRLTRLKGQELFLQSLLHVKNTDFQAVLVGDSGDNPGYTAELNDFILKNHLLGKVQLVGHCNDMPAAFILADIVLSTSSLEPEAFGRTTVEAMAMGKPVIATAHGGSLETVVPGENGWLVQPSDPRELASAIDEALKMDGEQLRKFGENGRRRVSENFTAQAMCEQTLAFYYELIRGRDVLSAGGVSSAQDGGVTTPHSALK
jgi:glycosyltransferase involved in cell wall biosynthesis